MGARLLGSAALLCCAAAATGCGSSNRGLTEAAPYPQDHVATRAYLRAENQYERAIKGDGPADAAAVRGLLDHVARACPNVLMGAPAGKATEEITREADLEAEHALEHPQRNATIAFARTIERLRWSNRRLTYYIRGFGAEARANAEVAPPDICVDARAVASSAFNSVPKSATQYALQNLCANGKVEVENSPGETGELHEIILIMLKPYERPDERALIPRRPSKRERENEEQARHQRLGTAESEIAHALGPPKAAPPRPLSDSPTCLSSPPRG
jgi:hypothetical protein